MVVAPGFYDKRIKDEIKDSEVQGYYDEFARRRDLWIEEPETFLSDVLGFGKCECGCKLERIQREVFLEFCELTRVKQVGGWGAKLTDKQRELVKKIGVSVQSGKGTGKTAICAICALWFFVCFDRARVVIMGPKYDQIKVNIWAEISKWMGHAAKVYGEGSLLIGISEKLGDKIYMKNLHASERGNKWVISIMTYPKNSGIEDQQAAVQGQHDENMLFIIDEASGVPDHIFEPIEGTLTNPVNLVFAIFNPNKATGWAIDTQGKMKGKWVTKHINAENSGLVKPDHIAYMREKYGATSNKYRVGVLGLPPLSEEGSLINWDWIQSAKDRWGEVEPSDGDPYVWGIDVGGGGDMSMICRRNGIKVLPFEGNNSDDTDAVANWCMRRYSQDEDDNGMRIDFCGVDSNGIGAGVYNRMRAMGYRVTGINGRRTAEQKDKYTMVRDELYWRLREAFETGMIAIPPDDEELEGELSLLKFDDDGTDGKIKIVSKKDAAYRSEMQSRLGYKSPNKADSLAMTYYYGSSTIQKKANFNRKAAMGYRNIMKKARSGFSWMSK